MSEIQAPGGRGLSGGEGSAECYPAEISFRGEPPAERRSCFKCAVCAELEGRRVRGAYPSARTDKHRQAEASEPERPVFSCGFHI